MFFHFCRVPVVWQGYDECERGFTVKYRRMIAWLSPDFSVFFHFCRVPVVWQGYDECKRGFTVKHRRMIAWMSPGVSVFFPLQWRHNGRDSVSNHQLSVYSDADQRKHQSSASLAFVRGIHRGPVNAPHKWPVTRKIFPFDDVIMHFLSYTCRTTGLRRMWKGLYSNATWPS